MASLQCIALPHGAYGIMVNTEVCGTSDSGSIPGRHPNEKTLIYKGFFVWQRWAPNRK